jgi:uncharacterized protein YjbI with pentapeptide repeats
MAAAEGARSEWGSAANVSLGTSVLLFAYVVLAVLKQSDAELIIPGTSFDLGEFADRFKDGIPGGAFVAPILQIKLPLYTFYTAGPVALLILHATLVLHPRLLKDAKPALRLAAIWLPYVALAVIAWRFSPYVAARPEPPLLPRLMEVLQIAVLAGDGVLVVFALIHAQADDAPDWPGAIERRNGRLLRAARHAGLIWLFALPAARLVSAPAPQGLDASAVLFESLLASLALPLMVALVMAWLAEGWFAGVSARLRLVRPWYQPSFGNGDIDMQGRIIIACTFVVMFAFPALGRSLDLSGESLVARAPTDIMLAAVATRHDTDLGRVNAWIEYGRGIDLHGWRFDGTRFDRATMANINLRGARLQSARLDNTNMINADLTRADLTGASLRYSDLQKMKATDFKNLQVAQNAQPTDATEPPDPCKGVAREDRTNFSGADFSGADLSDADLTCSILRGVVMNGETKLKGTILTGANLCGATLPGVDLAGAKGADHAIFSHSDLQRAKLPQDMSYAHLEGALVAGATSAAGSKFKHAKGMALRQKSVSEPSQQPADRLKACDAPGDPGYVPK